MGGYFELDKKQEKIEELNKLINASNFWDDQKQATMIIDEANELKKLIESVNKLKEKINSNLEMLELDDDEILNLISLVSE